MHTGKRDPQQGTQVMYVVVILTSFILLHVAVLVSSAFDQAHAPVISYYVVYARAEPGLLPCLVKGV